MTSYSFERFDFLPDTIVFEDGDRAKWRVCLPSQQRFDAGLGPDGVAAVGAYKDRIVGRLICRFEDGSPALCALYLDNEGRLHWSDPFPAPEDLILNGWPPAALGETPASKPPDRMEGEMS